MALPIFAITIFVSAFLLFLVQPMIGKLILPSLGGTPQVWNTCMVFFQSVLLLGYAYTHTVTTKLRLRQQLMLHSALLALPIVVMLVFPVYTTVKGEMRGEEVVSEGWVPPPGANPIVSTLGLLALIIGIPFFVVSTSAPLLQKWFAYSGHTTAKDPYYLYSVSNLGSLLSLFFYPALIEPLTLLPQQSYIFFGGYVLLAGLILYCAYTIFHLAPPDEQILAEAAAQAEPAAPPLEAAPAPAPAPAPAVETAIKPAPAASVPRSQRKKAAKIAAKAEEAKTAAPSIAKPQEPLAVRGAAAEVTWWRRIRWVLLAAVPSSMMLGVTSYVSTDLSPFPLVWIIPLTLYLLSFILVYEKGIKWTSKRYLIFGGQSTGGYTLHEKVVYFGQPIGILILCWIAIHRGFDPVGAVFLIMLGFFANALACHGELAEDRPDTKHLTEYFLAMSVGGAIGGFFNGIIAPVLFQQGVLEFYIVIIVACLVRPLYIKSGWFDELILNAFPGFQNWVRNQGDEMAKSMGRPAPRSTYLFSAFLDIALAAFVLAIAFWFHGGNLWPLPTNPIFKLFKGLKFISEQGGFSSSATYYAYRFCLYVIPMIFVFFFAGRPARIGLGVLGLLLGYSYFGVDDRDSAFDMPTTLERKRTYFGVLRVEQRWQYVKDEEERANFRRTETIVARDGEKVTAPFFFTYLMHGTTLHGRNYKYASDYDLTRLATTYYHRYGPVGTVMERDNWFSGGAQDMERDKDGWPKLGANKNPILKLRGSQPFSAGADPREKRPGQQNDFSADMRMPASMVGQMAGGLGPWPTLVNSWSEPPLATIGLGTGTMASYARPYQHFTYYEIDDVIKGFSLPEDSTQEAHYTFLQNAIRRGVHLEVIMGDARLSLDPKREGNNLKNAFVFHSEYKTISKTPLRAYAAEPYDYRNRAMGDDNRSIATHREKYYRAINVDAFSSDAIPVHLVTKQAIALYLSKLRDDGVLMIHTSNRHMDLVRPVARIVLELSKEAEKKGELPINCLVGKDDGSVERGDNPREGAVYYTGHGGSEYVMIYRCDHFTKFVKDLEDKKEELAKNRGEAKNDGAAKLMMKQDGHAPDGWQILNTIHTSSSPGTLHWYDPFKDHVRLDRSARRYVKAPVNANDSLWTDDFSHILGAVRWHMPWD